MNLQRRDYKLLLALLMVGVLSLAGTILTQNYFAERVIKEKATEAAIQWGNFLRTNLTDFKGILETGQISATDQILLLTATDIGGVFRYKVYERGGTVIAASEPADVGTQGNEADIAQAMSSGASLVDIEHVEKYNGEREVVSRAVLPFIENGEYRGAVEVYVDTTAEAAALSENSTLSILSILNLFIVVSAITGYFVYRNLVASNRDLRNVSEARDRATSAEREAWDHNRVLEEKVRERTADLEAANARINRMNRELESRVAERTAELHAREQDLRNSEQRFRAFAEASSDWFWELDQSLRYSYLSERFQDVTGIVPQDLLGKDWADYARDDSDPEVLREHLHCLAQHNPFRNYIERRTLPGGEVRYLSLNGTPWFDEKGEFRGYRGTGADITKLREAEAEAIDARTRLEDAIKALADGFVLYDSQDRLVTCNARFREFYEEAAENLVPGTAYRDIARAGVMRASMPSGERGRGEGHTLSGRPTAPREAIEVQVGERWLRVSESTTQDGGTVAIHTDISQVKRLQSESLEKERLSTLGELTAKLSHELRNPLGAIRNSIYTVAQNLPRKKERLARALQRIDRNIERCDKIITALLNYAHNRRPSPTALDFDTWLARAIDHLSLPETICLETRFEAAGSHANLDPTLFATVVGQIIENAVQALSDHAQAPDPEGAQKALIQISTRPVDDRIEVRFVDNGEGIDPAVLPNVFTPLFSTKTYGVGLGLATVKMVVEQHGGEVALDSEPGAGTTVTIYLPRQLEEDLGAERSAA